MELLQGASESEYQQFAHQLAFNVIPHIDSFLPNGFTKEEMKVTNEMRKIFNLPALKVSCTAVRIPILRAHSEALTVQTELPVDVNLARQCIQAAPGVKLVDDPAKLEYPMPLTATRAFDVEAGRIRQSLVFDKGVDLFVSGDQLLRGAALNAVLIAEAALLRPIPSTQAKFESSSALEWFQEEGCYGRLGCCLCGCGLVLVNEGVRRI